eukprot:8908345-Alexandrium_andersonii.AAC.1
MPFEPPWMRRGREQPRQRSTMPTIALSVILQVQERTSSSKAAYTTKLMEHSSVAVSYTHLRAHETSAHL